MAVPHHPVPGPSRSIDGISIVPGRALKRVINWRALKRDFLLDPDYTQARKWLAEVQMWPLEKLTSGATNRQIAGWGQDKAKYEQTKTEHAIQSMLDEQRKRTPELIKAKLNLVVKIISDVKRWDRLLPIEKKICYEILKTELHEPTKITTMGVVQVKDPVEALLEEYGLMKEGRIIIDDQQIEGDSTGPATTAISSGSPAEISSDQTV